MKDKIRVGTRGSALALYQAELVKAHLKRDFPMVTVEIVKIKTGGDMIRRGIDNPFETKRIYTREIEVSLLKGEVDLAVHSAKDMAAVLPGGLTIGAVFEREDSRDCLVSKDRKKLSELALGARIGTSSLRRKMQLLRLHPEVIVEEVHGNVGTRIQKIEDGHFDAVVLAHAGLKRLGLGGHVSEVFEAGQFYPAPGQGVIAAQIRTNDADMAEMLKPIDHFATRIQLDCERAFLKALEGGCQLPCGIHTVIHEGRLSASAILLNTESHEWVEQTYEAAVEEASEAGTRIATMILEQGGRKIIEKIKQGLAGKR